MMTCGVLQCRPYPSSTSVSAKHEYEVSACTSETEAPHKYASVQACAKGELPSVCERRGGREHIWGQIAIALSHSKRDPPCDRREWAPMLIQAPAENTVTSTSHEQVSGGSREKKYHFSLTHAVTSCFFTSSRLLFKLLGAANRGHSDTHTGSTGREREEAVGRVQELYWIVYSVSFLVQWCSSTSNIWQRLPQHQAGSADVGETCLR